MLSGNTSIEESSGQPGELFRVLSKWMREHVDGTDYKRRKLNRGRYRLKRMNLDLNSENNMEYIDSVERIDQEILQLELHIDEYFFTKHTAVYRYRC